MGRHLNPQQVNNVCTTRELFIARAIQAYTSGKYSTVEEAVNSHEVLLPLLLLISILSDNRSGILYTLWLVEGGSSGKMKSP